MTEIAKKVNYNIDELFTDSETINKTKGIKCLLWGSSGVGKTFAAMTFPQPLYVIDTDGGIANNLKYFKEKKIKIAECYETITEAPTTAAGDSIVEPFNVDPVSSLEKFDTITKALSLSKDIEGGTIIVDTITDIWSWIGTWLNYKTTKQTSKTGGEYMSRFAWGDANNRYDWIMKRLKKINCNLVMIARSKAVYDPSGNITSENKADAQKKTEYYMDYFIEMKKKFKEVDGKMVAERVALISKSRGLELSNPMVSDFNYNKLKELQEKDVVLPKLQE